MKKLLVGIILSLSFVASVEAQAARTELPNPPKQEQAPGLDPYKRDVIDAAAKIVSVVGVFGGIWLIYFQVKKAREERRAQAEKDREQKQKELAETKTSRKLREEELRWRKAALARDVLNEMWEDPYCLDAMLMLDWDIRDYCIRVTKSQETHATTKIDTINHSEVVSALRTTNLDFNDKEKYVRDCFDYFFGMMEIIEHYITIKLIEIEDVRYPFRYFLTKLNRERDTYDNYLNEYGFKNASIFLGELSRMKPLSSPE